MRKIVACLISIVFVFSLTACSSRQQNTAGETEREPEKEIVSDSNEDVAEPSEASAGEAKNEEENEGGTAGKTLVVYYSASGNTENIANYIAAATGGELFQLEPAEPYTDGDLDWTNENSRVSREHDNEAERAVELKSTEVSGWDSYDTVFIGYPIWWGIAAWPVNGFVEANDFTGKTVIPFCTSSTSGLGESGKLLSELAGTGDWQEGERFQSRASEDDVKAWVNGLQLPAGNTEASAGTEQEQAEGAGSSRTLIAYFSIPENENTDGVDAIAGASIVVKENEVYGNTEYVARIVQDTVGGDLFRIETTQEYPLEHDPLVEQASEEQDASLRPELKNHIENLEQYDRIILGFPNWWGDLPMPVYTFLEEYDFTGKTIIPFVTHGGSGFSNTLSDISQLQPDASVSDNTLSLSRNDVVDSEAEIRQWAGNFN